jgi:hypothetical protein
MRNVFISYGHEDEIAAQALRTFLEAKLPTGSVVFTGGTQLRLGDDWLQKIRHALKSAKVVIALFSPESVERPWVNFEAGGAWFSDTKKLIPVCIGGLIPARLPKPYSNIQGINLQDRESIRDFVKELWGFLAPAQSMRPFQRRDEDVRAFYDALGTWGWKRKARAEYKRRTGKDLAGEIDA